MILRKARLDDFETYNILHRDDVAEGKGYHWIYFFNECESTNDNEEPKMTAEEYFGEEFLKILDEEYYNYNIERFEKDLQIDVILMAENDNSEIVGYFRLFPYGNGKYKIAEWAIFNPDDDQIKLEMLRLLLKTKLPRLRMFSICVINEEAKTFLIANGFIPVGGGFFSYEVVKKKKAE